MKTEVFVGDITEIAVDAVVNAANERLLGGDGVDGAIHGAAGPGLLEECRAIGGCPTGKAVITGGYELPARYVIHTVGPVWDGGDNGESELLRACYHNSMALAAEHDLASIAFSGISTGIFGFPPHLAAEIAVSEVRAMPASSVARVIFVCFTEPSAAHYREILE